MNVNKKVCFYSAFFAIITLSTSLVLENNIFVIDFWITHNNYIINCLIGVFASSLLTSMISFVSYLVEKNKIMKDFFSSSVEVYLQSNFLCLWLTQYFEGSTFKLPKEKNELFQDNLKNLLISLDKALMINKSYSPIIVYNTKFNFLKKIQENKECFVFCQYDFYENIHKAYIKTKKSYELLKRFIIQTKDCLVFGENFNKEFSELIGLIDSESNLEKSRKRFQNKLISILKLNIDNNF